jgi:A/G-specific adenine glycosylase
VTVAEADLVDEVQRRLLDWYARHQRNLPWRRTRDPYAILVAEVMLQQTQVDRVIPKWHAWLVRFPTLRALAEASRADAIREWHGLGYNLRAVRLHEIARQVVAEFDGELPRSLEGLLKLKGVGRYTAGAVACFAYEMPVSMVDTNVRRVLARVFSTSDVDALAEDVMPPEGAYAWNQALMDLGATVCRVRDPLCLVCPLVGVCGGPTAPPKSRPQGEFHGSRRYIRGRVIDALRRTLWLSVDELVAQTGATRPLIEQLEREGLVSLDGASVSLRA